MEKNSNSQPLPKCNSRTEVYSRVVGYFRPVQNWNEGKKEEFKNRVNYQVNPDEQCCES